MLDLNSFRTRFAAQNPASNETQPDDLASSPRGQCALEMCHILWARVFLRQGPETCRAYASVRVDGRHVCGILLVVAAVLAIVVGWLWRWVGCGGGVGCAMVLLE